MSPPIVESTRSRANVNRASRRLLSSAFELSVAQQPTPMEEVRVQQEINQEDDIVHAAEEFTDSGEEEVEGLFLQTEADEQDEGKNRHMFFKK